MHFRAGLAVIITLLRTSVVVTKVGAPHEREVDAKDGNKEGTKPVETTGLCSPAIYKYPPDCIPEAISSIERVLPS